MSVIPILIAIIYGLCGYAAFIVFMIFKNYPSVVLGLITGVTYSILLLIHILARKGRLHHWYTPSNLYQICQLGFVIFSFGTLFLVYHGVVEIILKRGIFPINTSNIISIIWSLICLKGGLTLMYYSLKYIKLNSNTNSESQTIIQQDVDDNVE